MIFKNFFHSNDNCNVKVMFKIKENNICIRYIFISAQRLKTYCSYFESVISILSYGYIFYFKSFKWSLKIVFLKYFSQRCTLSVGQTLY